MKMLTNRNFFNYYRKSILKIKRGKFTTLSFTDIPTVPPSDPKLGNLPEIKESSFQEFMVEHHRKLGDIFAFYIREHKIISLGHPKFWGAIGHLKDRSDHYFFFLRTLFGQNTILLTNGPLMKQRYDAYITPTFNPEKVLSTHTTSFKKSVDWIFPQWEEYAKTGKKVPLQENFSQMILAIAFDVLFGLRDIPKGYNLTEIFNNLTYSATVVGDQTKGAEDTEMTKFLYMKNLIDDLIRLYYEHKHERTEKICYMDYLTEVNDPEHIFTEALTMFFSGVHTSNGLLSLTTYHLAKNQEKQRKLQGVLDEYISGRVIEDPSQLRGIKYLRACINEAARITPLVNVATRIDNEKDIHLTGGYVIPKGVPIMIPLARVLTHENLWENNDEYMPERFKQFGIKEPYQYSPFGFAGGRVCPGKYLAQIEIQYAIATLFKNFNITLTPGQGPLNFRYLTATSLKDEVYAQFEFRK